MAVQVKLFTTLIPLSKTKRPIFEIDWSDGLTIRDLLTAEGFSEQDQEAIAAVINNAQAQHDDLLHDGDRVDLLVNLQGGGR